MWLICYRVMTRTEGEPRDGLPRNMLTTLKPIEWLFGFENAMANGHFKELGEVAWIEGVVITNALDVDVDLLRDKRVLGSYDPITDVMLRSYLNTPGGYS